MKDYLELDYFPILDLKASPGFRNFSKSQMMIKRDAIISIKPYTINQKFKGPDVDCSLVMLSGGEEFIIAEKYEQVKNKLEL